MFDTCSSLFMNEKFVCDLIKNVNVQFGKINVGLEPKKIKKFLPRV